jgi:ATP-dependent DNA helicase RecG
MTESQKVEYKTIWRDEYLKWICGFANANGGKLFIGINDKGQIVGIPDAKRLMEDIPNKVVQHLGLAIETNLLIEGNKKYIEIVVSPSSLPVSFHGVFHYRSGSTKQELKGTALHNFLLRKMGKSGMQLVLKVLQLRILILWQFTFLYIKRLILTGFHQMLTL